MRPSAWRSSASALWESIMRGFSRPCPTSSWPASSISTSRERARSRSRQCAVDDRRPRADGPCRCRHHRRADRGAPRVALPFLQRGTAVLVEKPLARDRGEAQQMLDAAAASGRSWRRAHRALQSCGRSRPAAAGSSSLHRGASAGHVSRPQPRYRCRFDLMIHDLDVVLSIVPSEVVAVEAVGVAVLTPKPDIANARLNSRRAASRTSPRAGSARTGSARSASSSATRICRSTTRAGSRALAAGERRWRDARRSTAASSRSSRRSR